MFLDAKCLTGFQFLDVFWSALKSLLQLIMSIATLDDLFGSASIYIKWLLQQQSWRVLHSKEPRHVTKAWFAWQDGLLYGSKCTQNLSHYKFIKNIIQSKLIKGSLEVKILTIWRDEKQRWKRISPAYDPNSKDTWNSHAFCVGTHWKSENAHQCSSPKHHKPWPKHHRSITTRHWDTKASPTQSRDITNTKPRHHPHITKTSQHNHYTSPRHAQDITNTSLKDHQNITSTCRKHLDTPPKNHWNISEISPNHPWNTNKT